MCTGFFYEQRRWTRQWQRTFQRSRRGPVCVSFRRGGPRCGQSLRIQLDDALVSRTPQTLVLDFSGVGFMDSSGIGLILGRQRSARTLGTTLQIQHAPAQLRRVLQLAGIRCTDASKTEE